MRKDNLVANHETNKQKKKKSISVIVSVCQHVNDLTPNNEPTNQVC